MCYYIELGQIFAGLTPGFQSVQMAEEIGTVMDYFRYLVKQVWKTANVETVVAIATCIQKSVKHFRKDEKWKPRFPQLGLRRILPNPPFIPADWRMDWKIGKAQKEEEVKRPEDGAVVVFSKDHWPKAAEWLKATLEDLLKSTGKQVYVHSLGSKGCFYLSLFLVFQERETRNKERYLEYSFTSRCPLFGLWERLCEEFIRCQIKFFSFLTGKKGGRNS